MILQERVFTGGVTFVCNFSGRETHFPLGNICRLCLEIGNQWRYILLAMKILKIVFLCCPLENK